MNVSNNPRFYTFLREERQFSFLLAFFLMQKGDALVRFFELIRTHMEGDSEFRVPTSDELDEAEVYVEYAYLKDYWNSLSFSDPTKGESKLLPLAEANAAKRQYIQKLLGSVDSLKSLAETPKPTDLAAFNAFFMGESGLRVTKDIASPALWPVTSLLKLSASNETRKDLCKLKWSFRIKPDLVIDIPGLRPVCIEAKLESAEGSYPTGQEAVLMDKAFGQKTRVKQFELQQFMFEKLLGRKCFPVVIQKLYPRDEPAYPTLIWGQVLSTLVADRVLDAAIPFVGRLVNENAMLRRSYAHDRLHGPG